MLCIIPFCFNKCWYCFIWYCQPWIEWSISLVLFDIFLNIFLSITTTWLNTGLSVSSKLIISPLNKSIIGDKYNLFPEILNSVISVAYFWFGAVALKFLSKILATILPYFSLYDLYFFTRKILFKFNNFINLKTVLWLIIISLLFNSLVNLLCPWRPLYLW